MSIEQSSFFNSLEGDRRYLASQFAEYFAAFLTDGVFGGGENLQPYVTGADYTIKIKPGKAWIQGYYYRLRDAEKEMTPEPAAENDRIDRVVVRVDLRVAERSARIYIKEGTPAAVPEPPALVRDLEVAGVYEISLAQIRIPALATTIQGSNVTDERLDETVCGLVDSLIQADTSQVFNQFQTYYNEKRDEFDNYLQSIIDNWDDWFGVTVAQGIRGEWSVYFAGVQDAWNAWFTAQQSEIFDAVYFQFENWRYRAGHKYRTLFDAPTPGNITEEIRNSISEDLVASKITEFDAPAAGQIIETLHVVEGNVTVAKVTTFEVNGNILEVVS